MTVTACPIEVIDAPAETVWRLLTTPRGIASWADVELLRAEPAGPVVEGQRIFFRTRAAGRWWPVRFDIGAVQAPRSLDVVVRLPLGIVNHEQITLLTLSSRQTRVTFN